MHGQRAVSRTCVNTFRLQDRDRRLARHSFERDNQSHSKAKCCNSLESWIRSGDSALSNMKQLRGLAKVTSFPGGDSTQPYSNPNHRLYFEKERSLLVDL